MISFNLHIPSIFIGFLIGYIVVSVMWIVVSFNENWERGFGEGYKAGRKATKDEFEKTKECKNSVETEKQYIEGANGLD